jgi:hypothetical protein
MMKRVTMEVHGQSTAVAFEQDFAWILDTDEDSCGVSSAPPRLKRPGTDVEPWRRTLFAPDVHAWREIHRRWAEQALNMFADASYESDADTQDLWLHGAHVWSLQERAKAARAVDWPSDFGGWVTDDGCLLDADVVMDDHEQQAHADAMCTVLQMMIGNATSTATLVQGRKAYYAVMQVWRRYKRLYVPFARLVEALIHDAVRTREAAATAGDLK